MSPNSKRRFRVPVTFYAVGDPVALDTTTHTIKRRFRANCTFLNILNLSPLIRVILAKGVATGTVTASTTVVMPNGVWGNATDRWGFCEDGAAVVNLIGNGGFETGGTGGADTWASWGEVVGDGAIADEGSLVHAGSHACKVTTGATANTYVAQGITVTPGGIYTFSFWTRGDGTNAGRCSVWDPDHTNFIIGIVSTGISATSYGFVSVSFVVPAGCAGVFLCFYCPTANGGIAYFDDVQLATP